MCPYCGKHVVDSLDHFLPKSRYISFTVTPQNLVPSCSSCNKIKDDMIFNNYGEVPFHPYYDDFNRYIWLKVNLIQVSKNGKQEIGFDFYPEPSLHFSAEERERIISSFNLFNLNRIYKAHAPGEYLSKEKRMQSLYKIGGKALCIKKLEEELEFEREVNMNSILAAIYQAMIDTDWYWTSFIPSFVV